MTTDTEAIYSHPDVRAWATTNINDVAPPLHSSARHAYREALAQDLEEIKSLRTQIAGLEEKVNTKQVHAVQKRAWLSPIRVIPAEILGYIFVLSSPRYQGKKSHMHPLAEVSRFWREIALSLPILWQNIDISSYNKTYGMSDSGFKLWISRSKQLPLNVTCSTFDGDSIFELLSK